MKFLHQCEECITPIAFKVQAIQYPEEKKNNPPLLSLDYIKKKHYFYYKKTMLFLTKVEKKLFYRY